MGEGAERVCTMQRWEYCEIEVVYKGSGAESSMYLLRSDGRHEQSSGRYGEMMAALGEQGWQLEQAARAAGPDLSTIRERMIKLTKHPGRFFAVPRDELRDALQGTIPALWVLHGEIHYLRPETKPTVKPHKL